MKYLITYILLIITNITANCQIYSSGDYNLNGERVGIWEYFNEKGQLVLKVNHKEYSTGRIGAICYDGWRSYSTGRGTCSHHGGVAEWLYGSIIVVDTVFIAKKQQPLAREYSGLDNLSSNFVINPDIKFHYEIKLMQQTLPNSYIKENEIIWYPSDGVDYHYTTIKNVINLNEGDEIYKLILSDTKFGKGFTIPLSDDFDYTFWGSDRFFTIMVYKFTNGGYCPTDFQLIQRCYPYEPTYESTKLLTGVSSHIIVESFKYMYGIMSTKMDVFKIEKDKLIYEVDDYWLSSAEEESDTSGYSSEVIFYSNSKTDKLIIEKKLRSDQSSHSETIVLHTKSKSSIELIRDYYTALKEEDYSNLERIYCEDLIKFHSMQNTSRNEVISEHKKYLSKFKIKSFQPLTNSIKEDGNTISFLMEYSIVRKTDQKTMNFLLELNFKTEGNRICSLEETVLKRY